MSQFSSFRGTGLTSRGLAATPRRIARRPLLAVFRVVPVLLASTALAQPFNATSRSGLGMVGATHGSSFADNPTGLAAWHWGSSASFDGTGLPLPCGTGTAHTIVDTSRTNNSLTISMSGNVTASGLVNDCGSSGLSRVQDEWNFFVNGPTCFTMTVGVANQIDQGTVQIDGAYLLVGDITLTIGTLDAPSGIFRSFSGSVAATYTFAGTLNGGGYTVRISGLASTQSNPALGNMYETLSLVLGGPDITSHPVPAVACPGGGASFTVGASGGANTYAWRRNTIPISLATNATAHSATLVIPNASSVNAGQYDCIVTGPCSSVTSNQAELAVCAADMNCDSGVDINDLLLFLIAFESGSTAADLDNGSYTGTPDGGVDINDLLFFLAHFEAGC